MSLIEPINCNIIDGRILSIQGHDDTAPFETVIVFLL
jgi:hypothetical protein